MDKETKHALEAMEARLLARISEVNLTLQAINNTMGIMTQMLTMVANGFSDHSRRITDLEGKKP